MTEVPGEGAAPPQPSLGRDTDRAFDRFRVAVPTMATAALDRVDAERPALAAAPWRSRPKEEAALRAELLHWLDMYRAGQAVGEHERAASAEHLTRLAGRGVRLGEIHELVRAVTVELFGELWSRAEPADVQLLLGLSRWISVNRSALVRALARAHRAGRETPGRAAARLRGAVVDRLLAGDPDARGGAYLVVVAYPPVAPRPAAPADALTTVHDGRTVTLHAVRSAADRPQVWQRASAAHADTTAAGAFADTPQLVPAAAAVARHLGDAALAVGLPPGLIGRRELALELTLDGDRESLERLAGILEPLGSNPRLLDTLALFLRLDLDRTRAAAAADLSRRGLSLRLDRIATLTGFDPRSARGVQVLSSALSARALLTLRGTG